MKRLSPRLIDPTMPDGSAPPEGAMLQVQNGVLVVVASPPPARELLMASNTSPAEALSTSDESDWLYGVPDES